MKIRLLLVLLCVTRFSPADDRSVYEISPYTDAAILTAGSLGGVVPYAVWPITKVCPGPGCDANAVNGFDRWAIGNDSRLATTASDLLLASSVLVPIGLDYLDVGFSDPFLEDVVVFAETLAVNGALNSLVKHSFQRPIPLAYSGQKAGEDEGYRSFYSGHTSLVAAAVTTTAMTAYLRYHPGAIPWVGAAAVTATVGVLRVLGGYHFPSDVLVGGLVGTGLGILIPYLHQRSSKTERITIAPQMGGLQLMLVKSL